MVERQRTEINAELLRVVRVEAERQGRPEAAVLEEAVVAYLSFLAARSAFVGPSRWTPRIAAGPWRRSTPMPPDSVAWRPRSSAELRSPLWTAGSVRGAWSRFPTTRPCAWP